MALALALTGVREARAGDGRDARPAAKRDREVAPARVGSASDRSPSQGWYVHDANKLPVGSTTWWEQMQREGRLGGDTK
jgi:hypothetical protein